MLLTLLVKASRPLIVFKYFWIVVKVWHQP